MSLTKLITAPSLDSRATNGPGSGWYIKSSYAYYFNPGTIHMNGNCSLISKVPMLRHNHPWIALFQLHHFSWKPYYWWRHHPWMTSYIQFWWRHMTWFYFICYNLDPSMILPSFITNGSFSEILRPIPWSRGLDNSRYQGLLLEGPGLSEGGQRGVCTFIFRFIHVLEKCGSRPPTLNPITHEKR